MNGGVSLPINILGWQNGSNKRRTRWHLHDVFLVYSYRDAINFICWFVTKSYAHAHADCKDATHSVSKSAVVVGSSAVVRLFRRFIAGPPISDNSGGDSIGGTHMEPRSADGALILIHTRCH